VLSLTLPLAARNQLGESPIWDSREGLLYWVDSHAQQVYCWDGVSAEVLRHWPTPQVVGSIAFAKPGQLLLALADGFSMLDLKSGQITSLAPVTHSRPPMRLNDGRTDREGRYVCGSMVLHRTNAEGSLYRLEKDLRVSTLINSNIAVANSTCFSPDGRTMYFADSLTGVIRAWDYALDGTLSNERIFADPRTTEGSGPDGATVDASGCLWVALVLVAKIACYSPAGELVRTIELPVPYPTCPCFGGPNLETLYITSISNSGNRLHSDLPAAGALVQIKGLGVRGLPEAAFQVLS
jgi:L-arabinonolactonase